MTDQDLMTCEEVCDYLKINLNNLRQITYRKKKNPRGWGIAPVKKRQGKRKMYLRAEVEGYALLRESRKK